MPLLQFAAITLACIVVACGLPFTLRLAGYLLTRLGALLDREGANRPLAAEALRVARGATHAAGGSTAGQVDARDLRSRGGSTMTTTEVCLVLWMLNLGCKVTELCLDEDIKFWVVANVVTATIAAVISAATIRINDIGSFAVCVIAFSLGIVNLSICCYSKGLRDAQRETLDPEEVRGR